MLSRNFVFMLLITLFVFGQNNALAGIIINEKPCNAVGAVLPCVVGPNEFGTNNSGNDKEEAVEAALAIVLGNPVDLMKVAELEGDSAEFDFDPDDITNDFEFDWSYTGLETLAYATVKASTYFAIFDVSGQIPGTLSTKDLITNVINEVKRNPVDVSHVTFWKEVNVVPEPSTLTLLGLGLLGCGYLARRSRRH